MRSTTTGHGFVGLPVCVEDPLKFTTDCAQGAVASGAGALPSGLNPKSLVSKVSFSASWSVKIAVIPGSSGVSNPLKIQRSPLEFSTSTSFRMMVEPLVLSIRMAPESGSSSSTEQLVSYSLQSPNIHCTWAENNHGSGKLPAVGAFACE